MEKETTRISGEKYYGKVNLLYGHGCLDDIVIYKYLFTNQEINSSATAENNRKDSKQTYTTSPASTKNFRSSETSISATTTSSREETDCLK